ncbi:MAG: hypothetical protein ACKO7P_06740 [Bacteroidota bacterium]
MKFSDEQLTNPNQMNQFGLNNSVWIKGNSTEGEWRILKISEDGGQPVAEFLAWMKKSWWGKQLITPPLMPTVGAWSKDLQQKRTSQIGKKKEVMDTLCDGLENSNYSFWKLDFPPEWIDFQPFIWKGIQPQLKYTYRLDLTKDWRQEISSKHNNLIKKREDYSFNIGNFSADQWDLFLKGLMKHGIYGANGFQEMIAQGESPFFCISTSDSSYLAICGIFEEIAYYFAAVNDKSDNALSTCGLFYCIEVSQLRGAKIFDFEGSMLRNVERFFRGFGGELTPYFSVEQGKGLGGFLKKMQLKKGR